MPEPTAPEIQVEAKEISSEKPTNKLEWKEGRIKEERQSLTDIFSGDEPKLKIIRRLSKNDIYKIACNKNSPNYIFETLSRLELVSQETKKQRLVRIAIQEMFEDFQITQLISPIFYSRPDGLSVGFDENGRLIIEKLIEAKISDHAAKESRKKLQPERHYESLTDFVQAINKILLNKNISPKELTSKKKLNKKEISSLKNFINRINNFQLNSNEHIDISPHLTYETIICEGRLNPRERKKIGNINNSETEIFITKSIFSKEDLEKITTRP